MVEILREIELTLEAILISLSGGLESSGSSEATFLSLLDSFWYSLFFSKKELACLSAACRKIVSRIRNLQCFVLIRSSQLEQNSDDHFLKQHCNRLLASVSSLGKTQEHAPLLLLSAVCGSVFGSTEEEFSKASNFAFVVIQELDVFNYLCGILQDRNFSPAPESSVLSLCDFDFLTLPESLSVVSLCSHLAVFDLLALLARQVAIDSLGDYRTSFTRVLAKTLSVAVHCDCNISASESKYSRVGLGIASVIEDLAQRFPLDLDLLYMCVALLNTSAAYNHNNDEASIPQLVVQLISSVPYFAERFPEPSALYELVQFHEPDGDDEGRGDIYVTLLHQHRCFPPLGTLRFSLDKSLSNHMVICMPAGTRGSFGQVGTVVVWQHDYSIWPVINAIFFSTEHSLLYEQTNDQANVSASISRLVSCLDFVDACLLANIEPARCLTLTELAWTLVTSLSTDALSGERENPIGQTLTNLFADHLLPCLLRLTAHSVACADSDKGTIYRLSDGVFRCLQSDRILCPSVVPLWNKKHLFTLTDSCLLRIVSWTNITPSTTCRLISVYLDLALSMLSVEKTAFFADAKSHFVKHEEEERLVRDDHSPLLACLVFCYEFLIEAGGFPSGALNIIPRLVAGSPNSRPGLLSIVNKALLFFVELLTSYSVDNSVDDADTTIEPAISSVNSPILHFRDLRSYAYWLLSNSESFLNCIIGLTKVSVETLQMPLQSIDFDFLRFSTRPEQIGGASALGQHRVQSTWLAITLLHSLFPSHSTSAHFKPLLKALSTNDALSGAYFLHLLNFLDPACVVGLTRATVSLLKKLVRFSEFLVTPHLHDMQPRLLKFFTDRLRSSSADQVTRTALFGWLADLVMQDVLSGVACAPFNGPGFGLLRMISSNFANDSKVDSLQDILTTALKEVKDEDGSLSINLFWSLLKLVAAIWMQPNNLFRIQLRETADFWKLLGDPLSSQLSMLKKSKIMASIVDLEIAGNYATIVAVELFELLKSAQMPDSAFTEIVEKFAAEVLVQWIQVALQLPDSPDFSDFSKSSLMDALDWAVIRWKSVFCTLLKWNTSAGDEKVHLISRSQIVDLVDSCLDKATLWISLPQSRAVVSIIDQLAISLAAAAGYLVNCSSFETSALPVFEWIHRCIALLEHQSFSHSSNQQPSTRIVSHFQADLFAFIALLLPKASSQDLPAGLYERLLNLCLEVFKGVSLLPRISNADSQAFIQAMNVMQLIWKYFDAVKLAKCLVNAGIINNLIAILTEHSTTFQGAEFCQAIFRLLTRFLLPVDENSFCSDMSVVSHNGKSIFLNQKWIPAFLSRSPLARMLLSYAPDLVQALRLPPVKQMMHWLTQTVEYSPKSDTSQDDFYPNISWSEFLFSQLRFLSLLATCEGGSSEDTPMGQLLKSFILANHEQLCALLTSVPTRGLLIISAVLDLYWTTMHSSNVVTKLSTPTCVASAALFSDGRRDSMPLPDGASIGLPSDIWSVVYSSSVQLAWTCATLLLRPEIVDISKTSSPSSVTGFRPPETIIKPSRLTINLKLLPILRLLNSCLRLVAVETPMLGDLSFASASEIAALTPSAALNFATPSAEPSSTLTFGLLFSVARTSSQLLVNINNLKSATEEPIDRRRSELLSILLEVNELAFSLIFSQAIIWLVNPCIDAAEKHTLSRGLAVEFQSYNFFARSSRRGRKSLGGHTPVKGTCSSPSTSSGPFNSSESARQLHELFSFIDCAERFSEFVK